jgi:sulfatase maturation enzyme AslB (radical SAM superfamily)
MTKLPESVSRSGRDDILSIEVTSSCDNLCRYCFTGASRERSRKMDLDIALDFMKEGFDLGFRTLHISGGEPLLWNHLYDFIHASIHYGYESIYINSNGHMWNNTFFNRLSDFKTKISFSITLLGNRTNHEYWRGDNTWHTATNGLLTALDTEFPVTVFNVVSRKNLESIANDTSSLIRSYPSLQAITFIQLIRTKDECDDIREYILKPEDFITFVRSTSFLSLYGYPVHILENPLAVAVARFMGMPWFPTASPLERAGHIFLHSDRSLTHAHSVHEQSSYYSPGSLSDIINSETYLKGTIQDTQICPSCEYKYFCRAADMCRPSEWFRTYEKTLFCKDVFHHALHEINFI